MSKLLRSVAQLIALPLLVQAHKVYRARSGKDPPDLVIQAIVFVVGGLFVLASGGIVGITIPVFPVMGTDAVAFLGALITWLVTFVQALGLLFGAVTALHVVAYKWFMEHVLKFAKASTLAKLA